MKNYGSYKEAVDSKANAEELARYVVDTVAAFSDGKDVQFDFLDKESVGIFSKSLGMKRNWADLQLDEIAPKDEFDINVVPIDEADKILGLTASLIQNKYINPKSNKVPVPDLIADFLSKPKTFEGSPTLGHLDEFAYALAVELEHGRDRGTNVTMNHPLLTSLVVLAHLAEDTLYYARLRVMEAEGEIFDMQLKKTPYKMLREKLVCLEDAKKRLNERLIEKLELMEK